MIYQISSVPRKTYDVPDSCVDEVGAVRFRGPEEVRRLEYLMRRRAPGTITDRRSAGGLLALGLLNEVHRHLLALYRTGAPDDPLAVATSSVTRALGPGALDGCLTVYVEQFPPRDAATPMVKDRRADLVGELILLSVVNRNPACVQFGELHSDSELRSRSPYEAIISSLERWSGSRRPALGWGGGIIELLMAPIRHAPHSLLEQLLYIREHWGALVGPLLDSLLLAIDILREEAKPRVGGAPGGPVLVPAYSRKDDEPERYSHDLGWMPRLVLIAKHTLVWLHQLSTKHGRLIRRVDEIPDAEIDALAEAGFTGLWLIGLWRRSAASREIKRRCGNPEAVGSAYAIVDYSVEPELGGEDAVRRLSERCAARGIRLACDMVPNHTALDSRWVAEHPDWFLQTPSPPFPGYSFSSEDLSADPRMSLRIEDHYYDRSDAAVVFQRVDRASGETRYLYHGNDGTSTPWNDTAQLDFLLADVREAVIGQIVAVAKLVPIVRFDAAMVLARKHIRRLWHPPPGSGGDIPSRAERGLGAEEFDRRMPAEFWREVVDTIAREAPETLLLAEAFWLLEGYFVRTLGMHRVYNSAFMNMLKAEQNAGYRQLIKNTLEFDPEILKRFVNFMSNPDEEPAAVQFGTGDKYFGIAAMMATLPGLPMFGHGQIEGFSEKYGMEYGRAYRDESPDSRVVERHRREIFPLLKERPLFAEAHSFRLFDLYTASGGVNENVFAYTNRKDAEVALVVYNNRYEHADGWLSLSAAFRDRARGNALVRRSLGEELGLTDHDRCFCVFRDAASGLEYIRASRQIVSEGLRISLGAFQCHVFLGFREILDSGLGHHARLDRELGGAGTPSVEDAVRGYLAPVHTALADLVTAVWRGTKGGDATERAHARLVVAILESFGAPLPSAPERASAAPGAGDVSAQPAAAGRPEVRRARAGLASYLARHPWLPALLAVLSAIEEAERAMGGRAPGAGGRAGLAAELRLTLAFRERLRELGEPDDHATRAEELLSLMVRESSFSGAGPWPETLDAEALIASPAVRVYLGVNWFDGREWFRQEPFEDLVWCLYALARAAGGEAELRAAHPADSLLAAAGASGYRVDRFLSLARSPRAGRPGRSAPGGRR